MGKKELVKSHIDCNGMVSDIISEMNTQGKNNIPEWRLHKLPTVNADKNTIRQVWVNLISNAVKYSSNKPNPVVEIGSFPRKGKVVFYTRDNGVGFDEQYKNKLFKVFQRLHNHEEFEGTGVGLALVEKIVSRHGGEVWAEGIPDKGACFYFSLPN
jgi:light-regulated signal transduction histidine kinase (bacteriophytochrome)